MARVPAVSDEEFCEQAADRLARLPGVLGVALGGSRAAGTARPESDWDVAVYYRGSRVADRGDDRRGFDPASLGSLGWPGQILPIGGGIAGWYGGAWLTAGDRHVDVFYRDLDDVEHQIAEAKAGRFGIEQRMFHLAGMPTYILVAEMALNRVLRGELPRPAYPPALREAAPPRWRASARAVLQYARTVHAVRGHMTDTVGAIATAACHAAHAVLAERGRWVTNEKMLIDEADLRGIDDVLVGVTAEPARLVAAVDSAAVLLGIAA